MILRGIDFGPVLNASGAQGFFGEGYPFHKLFRRFGLTFNGVTFVAKTTTLLPRPGNMELGPDKITPVKARPDCIVVKPFSGVVLNAVGLSGPGASWLLKQNRWQTRGRPFFLSFMAVDQSPEKKLEELGRAVHLLKSHRSRFMTSFGLKLNYSCPNVKANHDNLIDEVRQGLTIAGDLGVPLVVKINALLSPKDTCRIAEHKYCDSICVSNTIPFGKLPEKINWTKLFGQKSPLAKYDGGALSGKPLFPIVRDWVVEARKLGLEKPIIAGGGILSPEQAVAMLDAGASAISLGTIAILRPWRMAETIQAAHRYFK